MAGEKSVINELSLLLGTFNGIFTYWLASIFIVAIAASVFNAVGAVALLRIRMLVIAFEACVLLLYGCNRCAAVYGESTKL